MQVVPKKMMLKTGKNQAFQENNFMVHV